MGVEMTKYSTADFVERLRDEQIDIARRHAELAALVKDLTVAIEAVERKVEKLIELEFESLVPDRIKPGIDPPDIGNLPIGDKFTRRAGEVDNTWNASDLEGEGVS